MNFRGSTTIHGFLGFLVKEEPLKWWEQYLGNKAWENDLMNLDGLFGQCHVGERDINSQAGIDHRILNFSRSLSRGWNNKNHYYGRKYMFFDSKYILTYSYISITLTESSRVGNSPAGVLRRTKYRSSNFFEKISNGRRTIFSRFVRLNLGNTLMILSLAVSKNKFYSRVFSILIIHSKTEKKLLVKIFYKLTFFMPKVAF